MCWKCPSLLPRQGMRCERAAGAGAVVVVVAVVALAAVDAHGAADRGLCPDLGLGLVGLGRGGGVGHRRAFRRNGQSAAARQNSPRLAHDGAIAHPLARALDRLGGHPSHPAVGGATRSAGAVCQHADAALSLGLECGPALARHASRVGRSRHDMARVGHALCTSRYASRYAGR